MPRVSSGFSGTKKKLPRAANLALAAGLALALAGPGYWLNRETVYNYYFIGHFIDPESALRSPHLNLTHSVAFVFGDWARGQLGIGLGRALGLVVAALLLACGVLAWRARRSSDPGKAAPPSRDWRFFALVFLLAPAAVLTVHEQKSGIVLGILTPGALLLALWLCTALLRFAAARCPRRVSAGLAAVCAALALTAGGGFFLQSQLAQPHTPSFIAGARKVNILADHIYTAARAAGLATPRIGVDQVTDCLDGQIMRVVCYERKKIWVPFIMTLPTGIREEKEAVLMERLAQSDFVFLTDQMPGDGAWPYDREMRRLHPQLKTWCDAHLRLIEQFPLFDRQMSLYQRREIPAAPSRY